MIIDNLKVNSQIINGNTAAAGENTKKIKQFLLPRRQMSHEIKPNVEHKTMPEICFI